jgi:hypothetical protein
MNRRRFAASLVALGALVPFAAAWSQTPGQPRTPNRQDKDRHDKDWDAMGHDQRTHAMERMRGHRHEPHYEDMRERWNGMSESQRSRMMQAHPHGQHRQNGRERPPAR